ncbi:ribosome maturation factor RimP [Isoptericola variabilis]|uniref:Ribosome maturation factor RimP n=1 Tax=Isoptericola variabilis (strain 225) TaxID=743718 RepID=F6FRY4_ISOV2|nr:ribosome maturation factor RimP [Isoptericola variabilis]AEG43985.1 Ribosome maturation factor rimP [Isoptericola variabilis 225]TWH30580.1 ribosome maturation factor RimP [Isoptericola variabilis J7]
MAAQQSRGPTADAVRAVVAPVVDDAGLHLEDVAVSGAGARSVVRITVDLPEDAVGSVDSDTLGDVSRAVSAALDADDVVPGAYTLEVSTPGTSRPLTEPRHFRRARTRLVTLRLHDGGTVHGRLVDVEGADGEAVLVLDDGTRVPLADVRKGKVEVELKRLDDAGEDAAGTHEDAGGSRTDEEG